MLDPTAQGKVLRRQRLPRGPARVRRIVSVHEHFCLIISEFRPTVGMDNIVHESGCEFVELIILAFIAFGSMELNVFVDFFGRSGFCAREPRLNRIFLIRGKRVTEPRVQSILCAVGFEAEPGAETIR